VVIDLDHVDKGSQVGLAEGYGYANNCKF
jgi:hypothetical protein